MSGNNTGTKKGQVNTGVSKTSHNKEKPSKAKRTHSEVSDESLTENCEMSNIQKDLEVIKTSLQCNLKKSDLDTVCEELVKQSDLESVVKTIIKDVFVAFQKTYEELLREKTGYLQQQIDSLTMDNEHLREVIREKDKELQGIRVEVRENTYRATEALKQANYNEQYSRKCNIRVINYEEAESEDLTTEFINKVKTDCQVVILACDIQAIHRIPGRLNEPRPIIVKLRNTEMKAKIMREKKKLKNGVKFFDDITKRNKSLLWKLNQFEEVEQAWYFNCTIFAKTANGIRRKYDILDTMLEEKIKMQANSSSK